MQISDTLNVLLLLLLLVAAVVVDKQQETIAEVHSMAIERGVASYNEVTGDLEWDRVDNE